MKDALLWLINLTVLPLLVVMSWLYLAGPLSVPSALTGLIIVAESALGAYVITRLGQSKGKRFSYKVWLTRTGLAFAALLPAAFLVWQVLFDGYSPGA